MYDQSKQEHGGMGLCQLVRRVVRSFESKLSHDNSLVIGTTASQVFRIHPIPLSLNSDIDLNPRSEGLESSKSNSITVGACVHRSDRIVRCRIQNRCGCSKWMHLLDQGTYGFESINYC